jgi:hypothetical protein
VSADYRQGKCRWQTRKGVADRVSVHNQFAVVRQWTHAIHKR